MELSRIVSSLPSLAEAWANATAAFQLAADPVSRAALARVAAEVGEEGEAACRSLSPEVWRAAFPALATPVALASLRGAALTMQRLPPEAFLDGEARAALAVRSAEGDGTVFLPDFEPDFAPDFAARLLALRTRADAIRQTQRLVGQVASTQRAMAAAGGLAFELPAPVFSLTDRALLAHFPPPDPRELVFSGADGERGRLAAGARPALPAATGKRSSREASLSY